MDNNIGSSTDPASRDESALPAEKKTGGKTGFSSPEDSNPNNIIPVGGRVRLYSESQVYTVSRCEEFQDAADGHGGSSSEEGGMGDGGAPFRGRSQSAPAALWAAKRYGRQLRRMSDEFDTWLDRGKRGGMSGMRGWFSFLWSPQEEEGRE
ncbi:bcl2-associated agonist of cell death isoform X2 [Engraulis encrasicolus]|uniref:bcl2-associated agonist of cell death isoform X2 n=1 Tax=Engraulis encrasicolus TaxID=184585 RepID=UPI002FD2052C